jgi:hypothetical protein
MLRYFSKPVIRSGFKGLRRHIVELFKHLITWYLKLCILRVFF